MKRVLALSVACVSLVSWADFPLCNLYNKDGFAAVPFRTDRWPMGE